VEDGRSRAAALRSLFVPLAPPASIRFVFNRPLQALMLLVAGLASAAVAAQEVPLPNRPGSLKFAVMGDSGTGQRPQYELAEQMTKSYAVFPFGLVIMVGDNMLGQQRAADYVKKFEVPYAALLSAGVTFQAALGNHDRPEQVSYKPFNMNGERYYSFVGGNVRFFALDSNRMDAKQLAWIETSLREAREDWKICYFHHPLYSSAARHGPATGLRQVLEPIFVKHGVNVVFAGHDHVYERLNPQQGIVHFVSGAGGKLRRGSMRPTEQTAAFFDQDRSFMLVEIVDSNLHFEVVSRTGETVDSGVIERRPR
jgi:Calcineurin-like phosphoesterase